jgi:general secretion pathway protein G
MVKKQNGFTLVEVIVVAGIIAILAGILVPLILKEIDEARITRAYADVRSISSALIIFRKDTGKWPDLDGACAANVTLLASDGGVPANAAAMNFDASAMASFNAYLPVDDNLCYGARWKGPYIARVSSDPWGNTYLLNANAFAGTNPVWILSAGPDGVIDTDAASTTVAGDDVGLRMK